MVTLFFWIGASIAVGMAAHNYRNRNGFGWFVLSLIISPVLAGLFLLACRKRAAGPMSEYAQRGIIAVGILFTVIAVLFVSHAYAQTSQSQTSQQRSFYDSNGSFAGSTSTYGNTTSIYDGRGHFSGNAFRNSDGSTSFYDGRGHFSGSSPPPRPR
jgi:hypothetical protein